MSEVIMADPDEQVSAMCHRNHVNRAYLYEQQEAVDAEFVQLREEPEQKPMIRLHEEVKKPKKAKSDPVHTVKAVMGCLARVGAGALFLCGVADGLIDTMYGMTLTIICIVWGLLHLIQRVARG